MPYTLGSMALAVVALVVTSAAGGDHVSVSVGLDGADAAREWVFTRKEASIRNGELVLDGLRRKHVYAFLKEPILSDTIARMINIIARAMVS